MDGTSTQSRKAQLDKAEREHLEDVVTEMRDRVEANVRYQLEDKHDLEQKPDEDVDLGEERAALVEAIELEAVDGNDWDDGFEQYLTGVGYTIVNRLAALRCMEVRGFIDEEVTVFRDDGLTPAADTLVYDEFLPEDEAVLEAYQRACDDLAEEIEILFDRSTPYSLIDPDDDTFADLCAMLDEVKDEVWRADDVLGWVYEYYNVKLLDDLRRKGDRVGLDPEDVPAANQFYTPHWVVRMLTDNSLGKLYLEDTGELQEVLKEQESLTPDQRKNRPLSPDVSPDIADFCTYLVPSEEEGEPPAFDGPEDIRVIDPACGSGHFLLYAFDVLERIWRAESDHDHADIPRKILKHNLYGVDLDMRACQLTAFNLYLKGRTRAEEEGADGFDMPEVGIVCADAKVADVEGVEEVFEEVANGRDDIQNALDSILSEFEDIHGLGSLLDVRGTLEGIFQDEIDEEEIEDEDVRQFTLANDFAAGPDLGRFLHSLEDAIAEHRDEDSFLAQDLRSFVKLLDVLAQDYDVALMNPPYGTRNRMPDSVQDYVNERYKYSAEYYINFFEVCNTITKNRGRIGMLVPRTFMTRSQLEDFRLDFLGDEGSFDFLAEFGVGVLDNATVRTAGTIVRSSQEGNQSGTFFRLHDIETSSKESVFSRILSGETDTPKRLFQVDIDQFRKVPGASICYSTPKEVRDLHASDVRIDADRGGVDAKSVCNALLGILTGDKDRFYRKHWETEDFSLQKPIASGGSEAWITPQIQSTVGWGNSGRTIKRSSDSIRAANEDAYGEEGLTWTYIKETGRRFGYYPSGGLFSTKGPLLIPQVDVSVWMLMGVVNSDLYLSIFLSQTVEREWNTGEVGAAPWITELEGVSRIGELAHDQYRIMISERSLNPVSPYYIGPSLYPRTKDLDFYYPHPHNEEIDSDLQGFDSVSRNDSVLESARESEKRALRRKRLLEEKSKEIDDLIYDTLGLSTSTQKQIREEIFLRTTETPKDREVPDPESIPEVPENLDEQVKDLVHHFAMEAVREEDDGIIPVQGTDDQADMLDRIVERFQGAYGEYAEDRLVEVDDILGAKSAADEAYPNLRTFIEDELFAYHVDTMENTPILWKISTERLLADAKGEGFACFLDYHQLDASLFDRLSNQYLEPRKAELRERRSAANQRRNNEALSTSDRADATEAYEFCTSALEQITELEEVMQELGSTNERDFDAEDRERTSELAPKVAAFREETADRIDTLEALRDEKGEAWFQDRFSDNFWDAVDEWHEEWLDALEELERACKEYARPSDEPVETHLADLFDYFNWRLKGSDHYSSTGILFMTYYFEREGSKLLNDDGEPNENLNPTEEKLAPLVMGLDDPSVLNDDFEGSGLDEYKELAEEIDELCQTIYSCVPSDWKDRALSEITTAGYQPNHKHGVAINITPLAEEKIVPEIIENKVI